MDGWMDGRMDGWVIEGKTDGEGTAKQQVQSSGLAAGQWKADRPAAEGLFILCPAHSLCVSGRVPQSPADRR